MNINLLKSIISESSMEIEDLAEQLNMSYNRLNHRLNNKVQFKLGEVIKLARILNISNPDILFSKQHPI